MSKVKKYLSLLLIVMLLAGRIPAVQAAGSAYMSGPDVVRAGDTITVSFSAGGGIYGGSGSLSYDSSVLALQGCSAAIGGSWAVEFSGNNFVFYDNSMSSPISNAVIFTATFSVSASAPEGTGIAVSVNNVTLSDGQTDMPVGTVTYAAVVAPPLSDNCRLAALTVGNGAITPAFSPDVTEYTASVPFEVSVLDVSAAPEHSGAKVYIENPALAVAATTSVRITVTAENGTARTYMIRVSRPQDPNYVPSSDADLKSLSVDDYALSPFFSAGQTQYYIWLPYETESVTVNAAAEDSRARVLVDQLPELIPGQGNDIAITVTAEDGTEKVYTVTAIRAPSHENVEAFLNGEPEPAVPTAPVAEPKEEPTEEPTTEPETQPVAAVTKPEQTDTSDVPTLPLPVLVVVSLGCVLLGAGVGVAAAKKKILK